MHTSLKSMLHCIKIETLYNWNWMFSRPYRGMEIVSKGRLYLKVVVALEDIQANTRTKQVSVIFWN